ncbi:MAG TPA: hypothetical protein VIE12_11705 [Actinomycetota bacterium]|jgi:plastocyanin
MQKRDPAADTGRMMRRAITGMLAASLTLVTPAAGARPIEGTPSSGSEAHVQALDDYFLPSAVQTEPGGTVAWDFTGDRTHSVTDASGMALFDSGLVAPGGPRFAYAFAAAGTFRYVCTLHETMRGRVWVVVEIDRSRRPHRQPFTLTWATGPAPAGSVYDVQLKRPDRPWRIWLSDLSDASAAFTPKHPGVFRVRARIRSLSDGMAEWSPATRFEAT